MKITSNKNEMVYLRYNSLVMCDQHMDITAVNLDRFKKSDIQAMIDALQNYHNCKDD